MDVGGRGVAGAVGPLWKSIAEVKKEGAEVEWSVNSIAAVVRGGSVG